VQNVVSALPPKADIAFLDESVGDLFDVKRYFEGRNVFEAGAGATNASTLPTADPFKRPLRCWRRALRYHGVDQLRLPNHLQQRYQIIEGRQRNECQKLGING
jgi:hypothetical protein